MTQHNLEYWRTRLAEAVTRRGSLQHPEVLRLSVQLDHYIVAAQHAIADEFSGHTTDAPRRGPRAAVGE